MKFTLWTIVGFLLILAYDVLTMSHYPAAYPATGWHSASGAPWYLYAIGFALCVLWWVGMFYYALDNT